MPPCGIRAGTANIQTLEDADRLPPEEAASLRADIVSELDELTALVSDVVELARDRLRDLRLRSHDRDFELDRRLLESPPPAPSPFLDTVSLSPSAQRSQAKTSPSWRVRGAS